MAKKDKYFYNPDTLGYEKISNSIPRTILKVGGILTSLALFSLLIVFLAFTFVDSPKSKRLKRELKQMEINYTILQERMDIAATVVAELEERDDNLYRQIFEAEPVSKDLRNMGYGGSERFAELNQLSKGELVKTSHLNMEKLERKLYIQSKSFDEIAEMARGKEEMLASIPAITPVKKTSTWIASGFGTRIDPIYKTKKFHYGMDFSGQKGEEVYATGDATVVKIRKSKRGYGNQITLDHGYGYVTSYSHLHKILVKRGQKLKRGELIGLMGSTGKSTAPHLHYEVIKDKRKVNPIYFFYNDLSAEEYDDLIKLVDSNQQSFD